MIIYSLIASLIIVSHCQTFRIVFWHLLRLYNHFLCFFHHGSLLDITLHTSSSFHKRNRNLICNVDYLNTAVLENIRTNSMLLFHLIKIVFLFLKSCVKCSFSFFFLMRHRHISSTFLHQFLDFSINLIILLFLFFKLLFPISRCCGV